MTSDNKIIVGIVLAAGFCGGLLGFGFGLHSIDVGCGHMSVQYFPVDPGNHMTFTLGVGGTTDSGGASTSGGTWSWKVPNAAGPVGSVLQWSDEHQQYEWGCPKGQILIIPPLPSKPESVPEAACGQPQQ